MINEEATFERFGYYPSDLKPKSGKKIVAACDDCGKVRAITKMQYRARCPSCARKGESNHLFGKHRSEETRKKISDAKKGKHRSEETRKKISDALGGIHRSEETRKKISDAFKGERNHNFGKHPSEETRKKLSDARKGENNPRWQRGISYAPYCIKFNDEFKEDIRDKFDRLCFLCGRREEDNGRKLDIHHVNGNKACGCDGDKTCQFVPLCMRCHGKVHSKKIDWEAKIRTMMKNTLNGWVIYRWKTQ